jgi:predicted dehydrogenase
MALKVGIVGMRGIGNVHAQAHSTDELSNLVAVCDVVKERADTAAQKYGVRAYYSLKDMLRNEDLDVVDVTTGGYENGSWHFEPAMEALEAGKNVLVEKPISNQITEARQMVAKAAEKNVYLGCNLNHFFTKPAERAMQYMNESQIGEVVYCLHKVGFNGGEPENYAPMASSRVKGWRYFHLKAFLAHPFSCMRHFCGDISHVQAFVDKPGYRRRVSDPMLSIAGVNVRFANGGIGYLLSQRGDSPFGLGGWWSLEVSGTHGAFCIENCVEKLTYWPSATPDKPEVMNTGITDFNATFPNRIHAYMEDVTNGVFKENLRASGRDALATLEYTWAVMESYENGGELVRPAALPPLHGDPSLLLE